MPNIKYTIHYTKAESLRYAGHLDVLRALTRAFCRAELPVAFSEGFNRHPKVSFLLPTGVGLISLCEQADVTFHTFVPHGEIMRRLNAVLPGDTRVTAVDDYKSRTVCAARYAIRAPLYDSVERDRAEAFFQHESYIVQKSTKSGKTDVDLMQHLTACSVDECGDALGITATLSAGNTVNIKPTLLLNTLCDYLGTRPRSVDVCRVKLYCE